MKLHYRRYGSGPPLVILHGFLGASGNWHSLASGPFGQHLEVFVVDQRNHGKSPHAPEMNYDVLAADLLEFLEQQDLQQASVLGHSMGGKTAMQFVLSYPERLDRLVVVDVAPRAYPPHHLEILEALRAASPDQARRREDVDEILAAYVESEPIRQYLLKNLAFDRARDRFQWQMNLDVLEAEYDNINAAITGSAPFMGPALFVRGGASQYVTSADEDEVYQLFPAAEIVTIPGAGHWVHADAPEAFAETVLDWIF